MANYADQVSVDKKFISNIVIKIGSLYFAMRSPDSGLTIADPYNKMVLGLTLNQAAIDIKRRHIVESSIKPRNTGASS